MIACPRCHTTDLAEKDRQGVKIDVCPSCRGVWLDRGELEKLIAYAAAATPAEAAPDPAERGAPRARDRRHDDDDDDDDRRRRGGRRSWWEIFD